MKKGRKGFTLIEVMIFLAISGLLFLGVVGGVQGSLKQQRQNDAVQNFMEFLRDVYSKVTNVQSTSGGQSERAIYGKLVTFGETKNLAGENNKENQIFVYTVVGKVAESGTGGTLEMLSELGANVVEKQADGNVTYLGMVESYTPKWSSEIQKDCYNSSSCFKPINGSLLIVRHPMSGNVYTYYYNSTLQVNKKVLDKSTNVFENYLTNGAFRERQVDFCVNATEAKTASDLRFDVRIVEGAHNASGIELIPEDTAEGDNKCRK